jgi:hypothetical protein
MKSPSELAYFFNSEQLKAIKGSKYVRESRLYLLHFQQNMGSVRFSISCLLMLIKYGAGTIAWLILYRAIVIDYKDKGTGIGYQLKILPLRKVRPNIVLIKLRRYQ